LKYLFQVNIGPIQGFIATARRTRDLKYSSWFLSDIARVVAKEIVTISQDKLDCLIFPAPASLQKLEDTTDMNVANKIVALLDITGTPQELGEKLYAAIVERLGELQAKAYEKVSKDIYTDVACKQVEDLIEFLWVAVPFEGAYSERRQELEAVMAARKNTRNFARVTWEGMQPKSSLDGQLESVIPQHMYARRTDTLKQKVDKALHLYKQYGAGPAEQLSGVDLLKRHGKTNTGSRFLSNSHIAALPFLTRLDAFKMPERADERQKAKGLWEEYTSLRERIGSEQETVPDGYTPHDILGKRDGALLFEERMFDIVDTANTDEETKSHIQSTQDKETQKIRENIQAAREALRSFYGYVDDKLGKARPSPYYTILCADGDSMGKTIDAQAEGKGEQGLVQHRSVSRALDTFAGNVRAIMDENKGALIYAGGDDVLALVPLHTVVECAEQLAESFKEKLKGFSNGKNPPSLSVGIAIVHHLDLLQESLTLARQTESKAKGVKGKNALAITVRKRSGGDISIAGTWGKLDTDLKRLIEYYRKDAIPSGTAYELQDLVLRLAPKADPALQLVVLQEAKRILHRKLHGSQNTRTSPEATEIETFLLTHLGIRDGKTAPSDDANVVLLDVLVNELLIAQTIAEARHLAFPKPVVHKEGA